MYRQIQTLTESNAELLAHNHGLQAQFDAMRTPRARPVTTAQTPVAAPVVAARPVEQKVAVPDTFDGARAKAKTFLRQLFLNFEGRRAAFPDDQAKILFALSYMRGGTAGPWADLKVDEIVDGRPPYATYNEFRTAFSARFGDPHEAANAATQLKTLRQDKMTADELIAKFQELAPLTGYNSIVLMDLFDEALNAKLRERIYNSEVIPTTLDAWYAKASLLDNQWRRGLAVQQRVHASHTTPSSNRQRTPAAPSATTQQQPRAQIWRPTTSAPATTTTATAQTTKNPDAMDVDSTRATFKGQCYRCGKFGHRSSDHDQAKLHQRIRALEEMIQGLELAPTDTAETTALPNPDPVPDFQAGP
jgi:hypothetical protein